MDDCLLNIFTMLNINDIRIVLQVCKRFNMIANNGLIWKSLFDNRFNTTVSVDYKKNYKDHKNLNTFISNHFNKNFANEIYQSTVLNLGHNGLISIPSEIGLLTQLRFLDLSINKLTSIPSEIGLLTQLRFLGLAHNKLQSIPSEIRLLTQLKGLQLSENEL